MCMYIYICLILYVCMYVRMHLCMNYVCVHCVCMYVYVYEIKLVYI